MARPKGKKKSGVSKRKQSSSVKKESTPKREFHIPERNNPRRIPPPHVHQNHALFYTSFIILFLIFVIGLFLLFGFNQKTTQPVSQASLLQITDTSCTWEQDHYSICGTVHWDQNRGNYAKAYIPGGEAVDVSPKQYNTPFAYCQNVAPTEGYRILRSFLYDDQGNILENIGEGVSCEAPNLPLPVTLPTPTVTPPPSIYTKQGQHFRTQLNKGHSQGFGTHVISLPSTPKSCTFTGHWKIITPGVNRLTYAFCYNHQGTFEGYIDSTQQYVITNPGPYRWAGLSKPIIDPPEERIDGYTMFAYTCDTQYLNNRRYSVRAKIDQLSQDLTFNWEYKDSETKPYVDFVFDVSCQL